MSKMLYLVRGLPGSGKSTFAQTLSEHTSGHWWEADDFFYDDNFEYQFDASKLHEAHLWCYSRAAMSMEYSHPVVIVSNTFTTEKELKPYLQLAAEYGYNVTTMIIENRHGNSSVHGVPEETMQKMRNRFSVKL